MSRSGVSMLACWSAAFVIALGSIGCGAGADGSSPGMDESAVGTVESEILGGTKTSQKEVVSVVLAITETGEPGYICTGVLMHNRAVITAAHCLDEYRAHKGDFILQVRTGSNAFSPDAKANIRDKQISSVIPCPGANTGGWAIHPKYDPNDFTNGYDFAVVVLDKALVDVKANIEWTIPPLTLPGTFDINPDGYFGRRTRVIGYGPNTTSLDTQGTKRYKDTDVVRYIIGKAVTIPGKIACKGDSGGPLIQYTSAGTARFVGMGQFGITSAGGSTVCPDQLEDYTLYTFVKTFLDQFKVSGGVCTG